MTGDRKDKDNRLSLHHPMVLSHRRSAWVECRCGWLSGIYENRESASAAWAEHVADSLRGETA